MLIITIALIFVGCSGSPLYQSGFPANQNWDCVKCGDDNSTATIFGMVRHALYTQNRDVYLPFDHSWIDTMLGTREKVVVTNVPRSELAGYESAQYKAANLPVDEVYQVIVSFPISDNNLNPLSYEETEVIDNFLTYNPCWIPIHEPPVKLGDFSDVQSGRRSSIFEHTAIFVQLPSYPFYATCLFFKLVTKMQFPVQCPSPSETTTITTLKQYPLGNIGWANLIHPLYEHLRGSLRLDKLFINPRAFSNGSPSFTINVNGRFG